MFAFPVCNDIFNLLLGITGIRSLVDDQCSEGVLTKRSASSAGSLRRLVQMMSWRSGAKLQPSGSDSHDLQIDGALR